MKQTHEKQPLTPGRLLKVSKLPAELSQAKALAGLLKSKLRKLKR